METTPPPGSQEYTCPICGQPATLGSHFCKALPFPKRGKTGPLPRPRLKLVINASIALALMVALLWGLIGSAALLASPILLCLALIAFSLPDIRTGRYSANYRALLKMVGGDRDTAERLIALEGRGEGGRTRRQRIELAVSRLRRDRA